MSDDRRKPSKEISQLSFEDGMAALEEIVQKLEAGNLPLEDSITAYEYGNRLKKHLEDTLRSATLRVEKISLSADGSVECVPLEESISQ